MSQQDKELEHEERFRQWLREIKLVNDDGSLNAELALKELHDYHFMLEEVPKVYGHVTGGKLSKPNYYADGVMLCADQHMEQEIEHAIEDEKEEWKDKQEELLADARTTSRNTTVGDCIKITKEICDKPLRRDGSPAKSLQILRALEKLLKS